VTALSESSPRAVLKGVRLEWIVLGVLMAIAAALILHMGRGLTFFRDEWTFVIYRDGHEPANFLSSYAGHLLLWPTALFVLLFRTVGLDHYELYRLAALPWHLICALLVFLLARRRVGDLVALAPATIVLFLGSSWMDILWPFQVSFTGAIAFGLAALLILDRDDLPGDVAACVCLLIALGWSGAALPFLPGVAVGLLVRRRFWRRIWVVAIPAVFYLLWLAKYGEQQVDYGEAVAHAPDYAWHMAGAGIAGITGLPLSAGPYLALLLAGVVVVRLWQLRRDSPLAWEALTMGIAFWGLTALARVQGNEPAAVRYVYPSAVFLLLLAVGLAPASAPRRAVAAAILVLTALTIPSNIEGFEEGRDDLLFTSNVTSAEVGALQLARGTVAPEYSPELNQFWGLPSSAFFAATDRYGSSPADSPDEIADSPDYARRRADATSIAALRVRLQRTPQALELADRPGPLRVSSSSVVGHSGGCLRLSAPNELAAEAVVPLSGLLIENASSHSPVTLSLRRFADGFHPLSEAVPPRSARLLRIPPDEERQRPWRVSIRSSEAKIAVCRVAPGASLARAAR
jgi:hypothetical protein